MLDPIDCEQARALLDQGGTLVDVRTPAEYAAGALPGAANLPLDAIHSWVRALDPRQPVLLYCRSGTRSGHASHFLRGLGFGQVYNLGAYEAWRGCATAAA